MLWTLCAATAIPLPQRRLKQPTASPRELATNARALEAPRGGALAMAPKPQNLFAGALVAATFAMFVIEKRGSVAVAASDATSQAFSKGLSFSFVALVGNTAVGLLRKHLSNVAHVGPAEQVGLATLIQGIVAIGFCVRQGLLATLPPAAFWVPAVGSSLLNALTKTLETKAFSESDVSLCAPFLAFDPVMQFVVGAVVMPSTCATLGVGCLEAKSTFPSYHPLAVASVATGAFLLSSSGAKPKAGAAADSKQRRVRYLGPLPVGSWYILLNCVIYAFTSRMDKAAVQSAGKTLYYAYGRLIMAGTCLGGAGAAAASGGPSGGQRRALAKFATPTAASLTIAVCAAEAVYMLSLYQAFAAISPVYVTAIKRGGGVLMSSALGVLLFGETIAGRAFPISVVVIGVVMLCL